MSVVRWLISLAFLSAVGTTSLVLCVPALAQSSPSTDQYVDCTPTGEAVVGCVGQSTVDGTEAAAKNAEQGTDAVNDAMSGTASSAASPSASDDASVSPGGSTPGGDAGGDDQSGSVGPAEGDAGESTAPITELPDTGGAPLAALGFGALLVAFGLAARRLSRR